MSQTLIAMYNAIARDLHTAGQATLSAADRFTDLAAALEKEITEDASDPAGGTVYKKPNGRFTEAGVTAVIAEFNAGRTVQEVAKKFQVHTSAIYPRFYKWKEQQEKAA